MTIVLKAREGRPVSLPPELDTPALRARLMVAGQTTAGPALRLTKRGLVACNLVGLVSAGPVQVQILPKIYHLAEDNMDAEQAIHLLLSSGLDFPANFMSAQTRASERPLLDRLIHHVAMRLRDQLADNPPRRYEERVELSQALRGRINFQMLARRRPGMDHLMPIRYTPLHANNSLSRLVRAMSEALIHVARGTKARSALRDCIDMLDGVVASPLSPELVAQVNLSNLEAQWEWLVQMADLLASAQGPDLAGPGGPSPFSILFPVDRLFELLLRRALRAAQWAAPLRLRNVTTGLHLLRRTPGDVDCLRIRPDLLLEDATDRKLVLVGDAKWKRLYPKRPSLGLNPEDAYQLISYMDRLELTRGFLCFPTPEPMNTVFRIHKLAVPTSGKQISVLEIDVGLLLTPDTAVREEAEANLVCGISTLLPGK